MNFNEELQKIDFTELFDSLTAYAACSLRSLPIKDFNGKQPEDLVADVIEKVINGKRNSANVTCSIKEFLFGCVQSEISAFIDRKKPKIDTIADTQPGASDHTLTTEVDKIKALYLSELHNNGADEKEIQLFELRSEGFFKPQAIAIELGLPVSEVNNIGRRLNRRMEKIKHITQYIV